jgi:hypothetical protein
MTVLASRILRLCLIALPLAGCLRETGDFGRAEPNVINDTLLPFAGDQTARYVRREQVSDFNRTDREGDLRDVAWALVMPPHVGDWIGESLIELQRTRILPNMDSRFDPGAYYAFLRREQFRSSEVRWARLIADMAMDRQLVPPFWDKARQVKEDDRQRVQAMDARRDLTPQELANAYARIDENARLVDWVWRSLRYRINAYRNAIARMAIETPSARHSEATLMLRDLELTIAEAEKGSMMGGEAGRMAGYVRPSRQTDPRSINEKVPQK